MKCVNPYFLNPDGRVKSLYKKDLSKAKNDPEYDAIFDDALDRYARLGGKRPLHVNEVRLNSRYDFIVVRCGQCTPCRILKRREATARILLECQGYKPDRNAFLTLTYQDKFLPKPFHNIACGRTFRSGHLEKKDLVKFFKRLRYYVDEYQKELDQDHPLKNIEVRYFATGEYGSQNTKDLQYKNRFYNPHFHAILFNFMTPDPVDMTNLSHNGRDMVATLSPDPSERQRIAYSGYTQRTKAVLEFVAKAWRRNGEQIGAISIGYCNKSTAEYVAEYVVKKFVGNNPNKPDFLPDEFNIRSGHGKKPLIGMAGIVGVAESLRRYYVKMNRQTGKPYYTGPYIHQLQFGKKLLPLDAYIQEKLNELIFINKDQKHDAYIRYQDQVQASYLDLYKKAKEFGLTKYDKKDIIRERNRREAEKNRRRREILSGKKRVKL